MNTGKLQFEEPDRRQREPQQAARSRIASVVVRSRKFQRVLELADAWPNSILPC